MNKQEIEKIKKIVNDADNYLDTEGVEMLQESITEEFPKITFDEEDDED